MFVNLIMLQPEEVSCANLLLDPNESFSDYLGNFPMCGVVLSLLLRRAVIDCSIALL